MIPKETAIRNVPEETLRRATEWCSILHRKILYYQTPQEAFLEEVKKVSAFKQCSISYCNLRLLFIIHLYYSLAKYIK